VTTTPPSRPSIHEAAGGVETFFRLAKAMHAHMEHDDVLGARFGRASASHVPHLAMWLVEVFGGPKLYSETLGDIGEMLARHANLDITEPERARFVEVACRAAEEVVPSHAREVLAPFRNYIEWGSHVAVTNSKPDHVADPGAGVPVFGWDEA
jgi:hemoglobin